MHRGGQSSNGLGDLPTIKVSNDFPNVWDTDKDVIRARDHFTSMRQTWNAGMEAFEAGSWDAARLHFDAVLEKSGGKDGPSRYLLGRMKEYDYNAPDDWRGYWNI